MEEENEPALKRWRLILGADSDPEKTVPLNKKERKADSALAAIYGSSKKGGLGKSYPTVSSWLGDIRKYFPKDVVSLIQLDAIERLELVELLAEKEVAELIEVDINLVSAILTLRGALPEKVKQSARIIINRIVEKIKKKMETRMEKAYAGYLSQKSIRRNPSGQDLDWRKTLIRNLKHYNPSTGEIIPERIYSFEKKQHQRKQIIVVVDSSASMSNSVVYAGIYACILANLPSLKTNLILFDSEVADLSAHLDDPTEILFGKELGGGTNIGKALDYARQIIDYPDRSILFLISDLEEGYYPDRVPRAIGRHQQRGTQCICLTALSDDGVPDYDQQMAKTIAEMGIPVFGCTPDLFPQLLTDALKGKELLSREGLFDARDI